MSVNQTERGAYRGFHAVDITNAGFLNRDLERIFHLVSNLNGQRPRDMPPIGIELYPFVPKLIMDSVLSRMDHMGLPPLPAAIGYNETKVKRLVDKYPEAPVSRVHVDMKYNRHEKLAQLVHTAVYKPRSLVHVAAVETYIGSAVHGRGLRLAESLGVGVNAHANVVVGWQKDGKLEEVKSRVPFILVENGMSDTSVVVPGISGLADPIAMTRDIAEPNGLNILLGHDHLMMKGLDPVPYLKDPLIRKRLAAIHVSNDHHMFIRENDPDFEVFIKELTQTPLAFPVRIVHDNNPLELAQYNQTQLIDLYAKTINWAWDIQNAEIEKAAA